MLTTFKTSFGRLFGTGVVAHNLHYNDSVVDGLRHCFDTVVDELRHCFDSVVDRLRHCFDGVADALRHCFDSVVDGLMHYEGGGESDDKLLEKHSDLSKLDEISVKIDSKLLKFTQTQNRTTFLIKLHFDSLTINLYH